MNEAFQDDRSPPELLRFANAYRGVPCDCLVSKCRLKFTTADVLHARAKQLPYSIPGSRHGYNVGCIERCSMFIELADYETVG